MFFSRHLVLCCFSSLLLLSATLPAHAAVWLEINGVDDELARNVRVTIGQPAQLTDRSIERYINNIPEQASQALSAYGYFGAEVSAKRVEVTDESEMDRMRRELDAIRDDEAQRSETEALNAANKARRDYEANNLDAGAVDELDKSDDDKPDSGHSLKNTPTKDSESRTRDQASKSGGQTGRESGILDSTVLVEIDISLNEPTRIRVVDIVLTGEGERRGDFEEVLKKAAPRKGRIFISSDYANLKSALLGHAQKIGYFDFAFTTASVRVSPDEHAAAIELIADTGPRFTFGKLTMKQNILSERFLRHWVPFEEGDPFDARLIAELSTNLQSSQYFSSAQVLPQHGKRYRSSVPVVVRLAKREKNLVGIAVGYATDVNGPHFKLSWNKPLINRYGHSFDSRLQLSKVRQQLALSYKIPSLSRPLTDYWSLDYGVLNEDVNDTKSLLGSLRFQRVRLLSSDWTESVFVQWERERSTVGKIESDTDLVLPGISYSRSRSKGVPDLTWGQSERLEISGANKELLSTIDLLKGEIYFKMLRAWSKRNTVILDLQLGAIGSNDFDRVPVSQRFFAGGANSVRGFGYHDLGPRNSEDEVVGGRYLQTFGIEVDHRFLPLWSAAVFIDTGRAFDEVDASYSTGAGVGIRWRSPVGPVSVDVAAPVNDEDSRVRLYLTLGPEII